MAAWVAADGAKASDGAQSAETGDAEPDGADGAPEPESGDQAPAAGGLPVRRPARSANAGAG